MDLGRELRAAAELATGRPDRSRPLPQLVAALAWLPVAGLAIGAVAAGAAAIVGTWSATLAGPAAVMVLILAGGRSAPFAVGMLASAVQVVAVAVLARARLETPALLLAPMLARWAYVVQCYGGVPRSDAIGAAVLVGRARFREFGIASVVALGVVLVTLDAVGLVVAVVGALVTLAVRVVAYRRQDGIGAGALNATSALVETSALVLLSLLSVLLAGR